MDSLKELLMARNVDQPSELKSMQVFLERELGFNFKILTYPKHTTICVENSKVAYLLRTKLPALEAFSAPTKPIHIKIDTTLAPDRGLS